MKRLVRCACLLLPMGLGCLPPGLRAQSLVHAAETGSAATESQTGVLSGLGAEVTLSGAHDSASGWYQVVTPVVSYRFTRRLVADASISIYPYRFTQEDRAPRGYGPPAPAMTKVFGGGDRSDTLLEVHGLFGSPTMRDIVTGAMTLPTGNPQHGLGTSRVTASFDNRLERYFRKTGLVLTTGVGDSSGLSDPVVTEDDTSVGPVAQFQTGLVTYLRDGFSVQTLVYEQLPLGDQKTYALVGRPGPRERTIVTGRKVIEDNGFNTSVYLPLASHVSLNAAYNRSLRLHLDTVSTGLTFSWRALPGHRHDALVDRAMREAEFGQPTAYPLDH